MALALLQLGCFGNLNQFLEGIIHRAVGLEPWLGQPPILGLSEVTSSAHEWCSSTGGGVGHCSPPSIPCRFPCLCPRSAACAGGAAGAQGAPRAGAASGELSWRHVLLPARAGWKSA